MVYKRDACPEYGACSFMGTASTMQVMAEALGIALPGSALIPTHIHALKEMAHQAGQRATKLAKEELKPSDIMTVKTFENAIMVHAAIAGSSNTASFTCPRSPMNWTSRYHPNYSTKSSAKSRSCSTYVPAAFGQMNTSSMPVVSRQSWKKSGNFYTLIS